MARAYEDEVDIMGIGCVAFNLSIDIRLSTERCTKFDNSKTIGLRFAH